MTVGGKDALQAFIENHRRLFVITGAGMSTASRIPDYRDNDGNWKRKHPVMFADFMARKEVRQHYWGRSLAGWRHFAEARPNSGHRALADLERAHKIELLVTQNVDNLHQRAGQRNLLALHGGIDRIRCMSCHHFVLRDPFQARLSALNPGYAAIRGRAAPDGDADVDNVDFSGLQVPDCDRCGGIFKPDAVFYGESVPRDRYHRAEAALERADGVLIAGSSLMVYSSYRLARLAAQLAKPMAAINLGRTRADDLLVLKVAAPVELVLPPVAKRIVANAP